MKESNIITEYLKLIAANSDFIALNYNVTLIAQINLEIIGNTVRGM